MCLALLLLLPTPTPTGQWQDVLWGSKRLGDLVTMTQPVSGTVKIWTPCFFPLQMQICCPNLRSRLFIFKELQFTKESLWIHFCLSLPLWPPRASSTWGIIVFLQLREVLTHIPWHTASRPFASPSWTCLGTAKPSQCVLQVHPHFPFFYLSVLHSGWVPQFLCQSTNSLLIFI